jgi:hypothetical protein
VLKLDKKILALKENLDVIRHFRIPIRTIMDEPAFRLFSSLDLEVFTNSDVRVSLGTTRKRTWLLLARLVEAGLIEKRGHSYRIVPSTFGLANTMARSLHGLLTGKPAPDSSISAAMMKLGPEFIEWAYTKGKIDRTEYVQYERQLKESAKVETSLDGR